MLEKILDKYYTKKLIKEMKEMKEKNYIMIYACLYDEAFTNLINLTENEINNLMEYVEEKVKE